MKAQGIPVVALMITGRPLYANPALNAADAFVVAWLPGSEGGGIADVLVGDAAGNARYDFAGKLPADWPRTTLLSEGRAVSLRLRSGLFLARAGLDRPARTRHRSTRRRQPAMVQRRCAGGALVSAGDTAKPRASRPASPPSRPKRWAGGRAITAENYLVQEGARRFTIASGNASVQLRNFEPVNIDRETNADIMLLVTAKVWESPTSARLGAIGEGSDGFTAFAMPAER